MSDNDFVTVTVNGTPRRIAVGTRLSDVPGVPRPCGGSGRCGKCKVTAVGTFSALTDAERACLTDAEIASGVRLACYTAVLGDSRITFDRPRDSVLTESRRHTEKKEYPAASGIAIDVGTTTVAAKLVGKDGETLAVVGRENPQCRVGADVISRIDAAVSGRADELRDAIRASLDGIVRELLPYAADADTDNVVVTGNTAMLCLLTGTSVARLAYAPYALPRRFGETVSSASLGLRALSPSATVYLPPCVSPFVGADTVSAMLDAGFPDERGTVMLADVGTNGEIALSVDGRLYVCSAAAGPAFEGGGITMGMRRTDGAVDRVESLYGKPVAHTVGECPPVGICGSGLIDAVAVLLENGTLDVTGYLDGGRAEIAPSVFLTQSDVRALQLAKGAIAAGIATLLHRAGISENDVSRLYLAGGFGHCMNPYSAARIGLVPPSLLGRTESIGNAALGGAVLLLRADARRTAESLASRAVALSLPDDAYFTDAFLSAVGFPE